MADLIFVPMMAAHLLCVNVASAGPLVCVWLEWREHRGDELAGAAGRWLSQMSIALFALGMLLGLLLVWQLWTPEYKKVVLHLGGRISWGSVELLFSLCLMIVHFIWWRAAPRATAWHRVVRCVVPLAAATNLLYHFPFLFVILSNLANQTEIPDAQLSSADFRHLIVRSDLLSRTVHFWLASIAVTGVVLILFAARRHSTAQRVAIWGGRIALAATVLQLPIGTWVLLQLPGIDQDRLLGDDLPGTFTFMASVLLAMLLIHQLMAVAMGGVEPTKLHRVAFVMLAVVVLMTATLRRLDHREPPQTENSTPTTTTHGNLNNLETKDGIGNDHHWRFTGRNICEYIARTGDELFSISSHA